MDDLPIEPRADRRMEALAYVLAIADDNGELFEMTMDRERLAALDGVPDVYAAFHMEAKIVLKLLEDRGFTVSELPAPPTSTPEEG